MSPYFFLVCTVLTHCIHQEKDLWWFICLEEGVTCCCFFCMYSCAYLNLKYISLFILHFPNLTARKSHARVLLFSYWIWKLNWKNKKQRLEFPLNLAVLKMEETVQGSKLWNIFVKSRVCWNKIWSVFFLKLSILNRARTILFSLLHCLLDLFFWAKLCYLVPFVFLWYSLQNSLPSKYLWDFFARVYFWLFIVWPFLSVILQSCFCWGFFFFTTRGKLQDLHWIKCLAALHLLFFTFYLLLFCTNLCSTIKTFVDSSCSSSVPLDMKAPPASCFSFQWIEGKPLGMSDQQLISGKSNIHFSLLFLSKGCGESG